MGDIHAKDERGHGSRRKAVDNDYPIIFTSLAG